MQSIDRRSFLLGLLGGVSATAIGARMIVQSVPYPAGFAPDVTITDGVWTWFSDPRAISVGGSRVVATVTSAGRTGIYQQDGTFTDLRGSLFQKDDHANPSLLRRSSDNKILAFACAHNGTGFYTYLSTSADDVSAFGAETNIDSSLGLDVYSYANPVQLTGETNDPIYIFFRAGSVSATDYYYSKSTDQGATWAAGTKLLSNAGGVFHAPYVKMVANGDSRIDFFCTDGHPEHLSSNSIYHFYYEGGAFKKTDGTTLTLPITPSTNLSKVYDGTTTKAWIWDCAIDGSGNPVCVYATFPSTSDHRYRYAKWNGTSWDDHEVCTAGSYLYGGEVYYSGGVTIDPDNVNIVYASRQVGGAHQIYREVTADGGSTWTETQMTNSGVKCFRPTIVRGQVTEPRLAYVTGTYTSYSNFDTDIAMIDSTKSPTVETGQLLLSGDMQSGTDAVALSGDMQSGADALQSHEVTF